MLDAERSIVSSFLCQLATSWSTTHVDGSLAGTLLDMIAWVMF